jgi:hypothetical protein
MCIIENSEILDVQLAEWHLTDDIVSQPIQAHHEEEQDGSRCDGEWQLDSGYHA